MKPNLPCPLPMLWTKQGCKFGIQIGSDWPQMRQIRDFFRSDFRTFWRGAPKRSEIWSEKFPGLSHLGQIWPTLGPNLAIVTQPFIPIYTWTFSQLVYGSLVTTIMSLTTSQLFELIEFIWTLWGVGLYHSQYELK